MKFKALTLLLIAPFLASCTREIGNCYDDWDTQNVVRWEKDENYYVKGDLGLCVYDNDEWSKHKEKFPDAHKEDWIAEEVRSSYAWNALSLSRELRLEENLSETFGDFVFINLAVYLEGTTWTIKDSTKFCLFFNPYRENKGFSDKQKCESVHIKSLEFNYQFAYKKDRNPESTEYTCNSHTIKVNDQTFTCGGAHNLIIIKDECENPFKEIESEYQGRTYYEKIKYTGLKASLSQKHVDTELDSDENTKKYFVRSERKE